MLLMATLTIITVETEAGVFKCETPTGFVYSEQPCAKNAKELDFPPIKPSETSPPNNLMQQMELENLTRAKNNDAMKEAAANRLAAVRKARCAEARYKLDVYQRQVRLYKLDESGERVYVDDDTRASAIENAKKEADANCDP